MSTPGRAGAGRGYYADPSSPIASTPQRGKTTISTAAAAGSRGGGSATPSGSLSPMRIPEKPHQRHDPPAEEGGTKTWGIFSPVLNFLNPGGEDQTSSSTNASSNSSSAAAGGAGGGGGAGAMPTTPTLAAAPVGRKATITTATATTSPSGNTSLKVATPSSSSVEAPVAVAAASGSADVEEEEEDEGAYDEFNPYLFIKMLPPYASVAPRPGRILLPAKKSRMPPINLVLDLDETLVHCSVEPIPDPDVTFTVAFAGSSYAVYVRKRPHLDKFLEWIAGRFEVTIFTASQQVYAERLLNLLDPESKAINHRLYRDSCLNVGGNYLKDLNVLGRDMTKTVLVDNSPHAFGYQVDNGIPIESWFDDPADRELLKLIVFLETLLPVSDVRPLVRDKFKLHKLISEAKPSYYGGGY